MSSLNQFDPDKWNFCSLLDEDSGPVKATVPDLFFEDALLQEMTELSSKCPPQTSVLVDEVVKRRVMILENFSPSWDFYESLGNPSPEILDTEKNFVSDPHHQHLLTQDFQLFPEVTKDSGLYIPQQPTIAVLTTPQEGPQRLASTFWDFDPLAFKHYCAAYLELVEEFSEFAIDSSPMAFIRSALKDPRLDGFFAQIHTLELQDRVFWLVSTYSNRIAMKIRKVLSEDTCSRKRGLVRAMTEKLISCSRRKLVYTLQPGQTVFFLASQLHGRLAVPDTGRMAGIAYGTPFLNPFGEYTKADMSVWDVQLRKSTTP